MLAPLRLIAIISLSILAARSAVAALVPPDFLNGVVALGATFPDQQSPIPKWHTAGTGFFYGYLVQDDPEPTKRQYAVYLVTAKHIIEAHTKAQAQAQAIGQKVLPLKVRINPSATSPPGTEFDLLTELADDKATWKFHPRGVDVAVLSVNADMLHQRGYQFFFFASDLFVANSKKLKELGVSAGDGAYVLGFPMDLAGVQRNYVIVRQGSIARISEMLDGASPTFMLDAFVFPGNSGGPIILKPEAVSITGTPSQPKTYLIGLVSESISYVDIAVSHQTQHPRIIFEENAGLAQILPVDYIDETIAEARKGSKN